MSGSFLHCSLIVETGSGWLVLLLVMMLVIHGLTKKWLGPGDAISFITILGKQVMGFIFKEKER